MKPFDTIYRAQKNKSVKPSQKPEKYWPYFYKSLQIVLSVWIVTVMAIFSYPWLDYWVKSLVKQQTANRLQTTADILGMVSEDSVVGSQSTVSEAQFYLKSAKVDIYAPIIEGIDEEALKNGIGHHPDSVWPDQEGNVVLAGHNFDLDVENEYGKVFISLRLVEINDEVIIEYQGKKYIYQVFKKETVKPDDTTLFRESDEWLLTFYTCDPPYTDWKRLVVQAKLIKIE